MDAKDITWFSTGDVKWAQDPAGQLDWDKVAQWKAEEYKKIEAFKAECEKDPVRFFAVHAFCEDGLSVKELTKRIEEHELVSAVKLYGLSCLKKSGLSFTKKMSLLLRAKRELWHFRCCCL